VLVIDGEAMTESVFIAQYLDETGAGTLQPKDSYEHWQMLMWCRRVTERCAPAAAFLGCRAHSSGVLGSPAIASEDLAERWQAVRAGSFPEAQVSDSIRHVTATAQMVEDQLADRREWLMQSLSIADFETYCWLAGMVNDVPAAFADKPKLQSWLERVTARPSVQAAFARASVAEPLNSWAPGPEINRWG
jgi:GSH-dependent disulfide-bond oxidoreductase